MNFGLYHKPKRNAGGNKASSAPRRSKEVEEKERRKQAGNGRKTRRAVEKEKEGKPEKGAHLVCPQERRRGGPGGRVGWWPCARSLEAPGVGVFSSSWRDPLH